MNFAGLNFLLFFLAFVSAQPETVGLKWEIKAFSDGLHQALDGKAVMALLKHGSAFTVLILVLPRIYQVGSGAQEEAEITGGLENICQSTKCSSLMDYKAYFWIKALINDHCEQDKASLLSLVDLINVLMNFIVYLVESILKNLTLYSSTAPRGRMTLYVHLSCVVFPF